MNRKALMITIFSILAIWGTAWRDQHPGQILQDLNPASQTVTGQNRDSDPRSQGSETISQRLKALGNRMVATFNTKQPTQEGSAQLQAAVQLAMTRPYSDLAKDLADLNQTLCREKWIERANAWTLTPEEQETLRRLFDQESVLHLALIQQKLAAAEKEFL